MALVVERSQAPRVNRRLTVLAHVHGRTHTGHLAVRDEDTLAAVLANVHVPVGVDLAQVVPADRGRHSGRRHRDHRHLAAVACVARLTAAHRLRDIVEARGRWRLGRCGWGRCGCRSGCGVGT